MYNTNTNFLLVTPKLNARGRDLLQKLLVCNPAGRLFADQAMSHSYFSDLNQNVRI